MQNSEENVINPKIEEPLAEVDKIPVNELNGSELGVGFDEDEKQWEVIIKYSGDIKYIEYELGVKIEILSPNYAIVTLEPSKINLLGKYPEVEYMEQPKNLGIMLSRSMVSSCIYSVQNLPQGGLKGKGVIVAIIDSGIDYRHPDFINEDGTTRILSMWDQSNSSGTPPQGFTQGSVYSSEEINKAISMGERGFEIVPEEDTIGHGTAVAGIAAGNGRGSKEELVGAAPEASIVVVKLGRKGQESFARTTEIMRALKFCVDTALNAKMPISINISYGTNDGAHDGKSIFETYINEIAQMWKTVIVVAAGNEGGAGHHFRDKVNTGQTIDVEFTVVNSLSSLYVVCWKNFVDIFNFEVIAPNGMSTGVVTSAERLRRFVLGNTILYIIHGQPNYYNGQQEVYFQFLHKFDYVDAGVWTIKVTGVSVVSGEFDMWLPITEAVTRETAFLRPNADTTLTIPSTTDEVITVGGYSDELNSISDFSGRGYTWYYNVVKPDIVAPSSDIKTSAPGGGYDTFAGTSFAAPHVTGGAALLMEWGIVKNNNPYLYGQRLKAYLQLGAIRDKAIPYPNKEWGYGKLCVKNSLDYLKQFNLLERAELTAMANNTNNIEGSFKFEETKEIVENKAVEAAQSDASLAKDILSDNYVDIILAYAPYISDFVNTVDYIKGLTVLDNSYAILYVRSDALDEFYKTFSTRIISNEATVLGLMDKQALDASGITIVQNNPILNLRGSGTLIAIIDTGIDYRNPSFIYEDGRSKIQYLWDQSIQTKIPSDFLFGTEYTNAQINEALSSDNPLTVVPHKDDVGHGTFLASVAAGREYEGNLGAAPDADLIIVKLKPAKAYNKFFFGISNNITEAYLSSDVMLALEYVRRRASFLKRPVAICIGLGTNSGGHNDTSILEQFINRIAAKSGAVICIAAGNESNVRRHAEGKIAKTGDTFDFEIKSGTNETGFSVFLTNSAPDQISVSLKSPTGEVINRLPPFQDTYRVVNLILEKSVVTVGYLFPEVKTGTQITFIQIKDPTPGIWTVTAHGDEILNGVVNAWLPIYQFAKPDTYFLASSPNFTVTIPGTASNAICCGAYNSLDGSIFVSSSRGDGGAIENLPDLVAPGVNVGGIFPTGFGTMNGTSVATAITAGACALILEWGIIKGNKPSINTSTAKNYLIRGARRKRNITYPNNIWGFGELDLYNTFQQIK